MVRARLVIYAAEKGSRSLDRRCLRWVMGPTRTAKLGEIDLISGRNSQADLIFDEPKHNQDTAQAGMKGV